MEPNKPVKLVPAIDIYATYRCNLRCSHCFMGSKLDEATHFDLDLLQTLIKVAPSWGTEEITFLGGEHRADLTDPTLRNRRLSELHSNLKRKSADDDIAFIWLYPNCGSTAS